MSEPIGNTEQLPIAYCKDLDELSMSFASKLLGLDMTDKEFLFTPLYAHPPIKQSSLAEPVAVRYDYDGHGYLYMDAGSGSDWASRVKDAELLFTHSQRELSDEEYEKIMKQWDYWRKQIAEGDKSSAPRDWFEGVVDDLLDRGEK